MGHPERACRRLESFLDDLEPTERMTAYVRPTLAWAYLEVGDPVKAEKILRLTISRARSTGNQVGLVEALRVQAMLTTRQGRWAQAEQALEEGMLLAQRMPYPYVEARLLQLCGQMHLERGESGPAQERLGQALAIFRRLGAQKDIARVEQIAWGLM
jgi:Tfp pilus assembly protein PilF